MEGTTVAVAEGQKRSPTEKLAHNNGLRLFPFSLLLHSSRSTVLILIIGMTAAAVDTV